MEKKSAQGNKNQQRSAQGNKKSASERCEIMKRIKLNVKQKLIKGRNKLGFETQMILAVTPVFTFPATKPLKRTAL